MPLWNPAGRSARLNPSAIRDGFLARHVPTIRARYRAQAQAMAQALASHMPAGTHWQMPQGGMFFWLRLPPGCDATALLPLALAAGIAFVPGAAFYVGPPDPRTLRLSFVTLSPDQVNTAVARLGQVLAQHRHSQALQAA